MILSKQTIQKLLDETTDPDVAAVLKSYEFLREELKHSDEMADEWKKLYHKSQIRVTELKQSLDDIFEEARDRNLIE